MRSGSYTDDEDRRATDMYFEGGMSHADVRKALGYPGHSTLSRWTRDNPRFLDHRIAQAAASVGGGGCAKSPRKSYSYEVKLEAVRLAEESHLTRREIAEALDLCAPAMVSKVGGHREEAREGGAHAKDEEHGHERRGYGHGTYLYFLGPSLRSATRVSLSGSPCH